MPNKNTLIFAIVIAAVIVVVGLFVGLNNKNTLLTPPPTPNLQNSASGTSGNTNSAPSEVEGWKTYRNEKYGFEFKYPFDMTIKSQEKVPFEVILVRLKQGTEEYEEIKLNFNNKAIDLDLRTEIPCDAEEYFHAIRYRLPRPIDLEKRLNLNNNLSAWQILQTHQGINVVTTYVSVLDCYSKQNKSVIEVSQRGWPTTKEYDAILSTIKFFPPLIQ